MYISSGTSHVPTPCRQTPCQLETSNQWYWLNAGSDHFHSFSWLQPATCRPLVEAGPRLQVVQRHWQQTLWLQPELLNQAGLPLQTSAPGAQPARLQLGAGNYRKPSSMCTAAMTLWSVIPASAPLLKATALSS